MTLGKGRAEAITDRDIALLADEIGCHPADLEAIAEVESNGFGWFADGRMKILFEKHWFYKNLSGDKRSRAAKSGLARRKWISPKNGGYKDQNGADARYRILEQAIAIDEEAAFRSISMGRFQIMGFNYALCGFTSAKHMWERFLDSEVNQLQAFATFLRKKGLYGALRNHDFAAIERTYNGGGLNGAYAAKMRSEASRLRAGKWKGYTPGQFGDAPDTPPNLPDDIVLDPELGHDPAPPAPTGRNAILVAVTAVVSAAAVFFDKITNWIGGLF